MNNLKEEKLNPSLAFWYKDCFHMLLLAILSYYDGDVYDLLLNSYYLYNIDEDNQLFFDEVFITNDDIYTILGRSGIKCEGVFIRKEDVVNKLIETFEESDFYIVGVDSYFESIRSDTYNREHLAHALFIYNLDKSNEIFHVYEHTFRFSSTYKKKELSFTEVSKAINYFQSNLTNPAFTKNTIPAFCLVDNKFPAYFRFKKDSNYNTSFEKSNTILKFLFYYKSKLSYVKESVDLITKFRDGYKDIYLSKERLEKSLENINRIIINKKIEFYIFNEILNSVNDLDILQNKCIVNWSYVRAVSAKKLYSEKVNYNHLRDIMDRLNEIIENEKLYYTLLEQLCEMKVRFYNDK